MYAEKFQSALDKHLRMQEAERQRLAKHRQKARHNPSRYSAVIIDGMDQSKTILPHFRRVPKDSKIKEGNFVKVHVVGAKLVGTTCKAYAFLMFDNFKSDSNCMLTVLHKVVSNMDRPLPKVLFLTLDNTTKENKNKFVLAYLTYLVKMRVFEKVKLNFLLVGHTHEDIDQMFSCFSRSLRRKEAHDLPMLKEVIQESYKIWGGVIIDDIHETIDWKLFVEGHLLNVNDITYNQHFRVKRQGEVTKIWCKQFCHSRWYPDDGMNIFRTEPEGIITCAPRHPLRSVEERARFQIDGTQGDSKSSIDGIKSNLTALVKYMQQTSVDWWIQFLDTQENEDFDKKDLEHDFTWPEPAEDAATPADDNNGTVQDEDVEQMFPEERPMYTGTRRTQQYRQERQGDLTDMLPGHFVALRATQGEEENGKAFHIAKVVRLLPGKRFEVHWYAERGAGKYYPFNEKGRDGRVNKKPVLQTFGWDCGILCYNFKLKADRALLANTLGKINELLQEVPVEGALSDENISSAGSESQPDSMDENDGDSKDGDDSSNEEADADAHDNDDDDGDDDDDEEDEDTPLLALRRNRHR
jgi:hypothetical protein